MKEKERTLLKSLNGLVSAENAITPPKPRKLLGSEKLETGETISTNERETEQRATTEPIRKTTK